MSNISASMDVLFGATRQRVLAELLLEPDTAVHLRELARRTGSHAGTVLRELDKLAGAGLLLRSEQGNQVCYQANRRHPLFDELAAIFRKTHGAAAVLRQAIEPLGSAVQLALIFGSVARGLQSAASDIDVLVIGTVPFDRLVGALYPAQHALGREINPVLYAADEFATRIRKGEAFARQLLAQPVVFLKGDQDELAELAGHQAIAGTAP